MNCVGLYEHLLFWFMYAMQRAKGLSEGSYKSADVVINKYPPSLSPHHSHLSSKTVVPNTVKHDNDSSIKRKLFYRKCLDDSESHDINPHDHKSAPKDRGRLRKLIGEAIYMIIMDQYYCMTNCKVSHLVHGHTL